MKVVCISGKAQHGKDTAASVIKETLEERGQKVLITYYAGLVKYICRTFFDWDGNKDEYGRYLLQHVGTDVVRKQSPNFWADFLSDILKMFDGEWDYVLIPDTRFPNELEVMKKNFETNHIRVVRPNYQSSLTQEQQTHISEIALDNSTPDFTIVNNGTIEDMRRPVLCWVNTQGI